MKNGDILEIENLLVSGVVIAKVVEIREYEFIVDELFDNAMYFISFDDKVIKYKKLSKEDYPQYYI